jgi:hypothetical protein
MATNYPDSVNETSVQDGLEFQDMVCDLLRPYGVFIQNYSSRRYQFDVGENPQGIEIKLDRRCTETGRLSIEVAEKSKAANANFVPSGIYRKDNTWLYVQGNQNVIYLFGRSFLRSLHKTGKYKEHTEPTVKAFFLPFEAADRYAVLKIEPEVEYRETTWQREIMAAQ